MEWVIGSDRREAEKVALRQCLREFKSQVMEIWHSPRVQMFSSWNINSYYETKKFCGQTHLETIGFWIRKNVKHFITRLLRAFTMVTSISNAQEKYNLKYFSNFLFNLEGLMFQKKERKNKDWKMFLEVRNGERLRISEEEVLWPTYVLERMWRMEWTGRW